MTPILIFLSISLGFLVFAGQVPALPWGLLLMLLCILFAAAGISEYWRWVRLTNAEVRKKNKIAERNSDIEYANAVERMTRQILMATPEQARIISSLTAVIICEAGLGEPVYKLRIDDQEWDWEAVTEFADASRGARLPPVGGWSEGSPGRALAQKLTAFWIARGFVSPASGPYSARWLDKAAAMKSIGLEG